MLKNLTLKAQVDAYKDYCKKNNLRPQDFVNLNKYLKEHK